MFLKNGKTDWEIGRILQFAYYLEKTKKARQCKATSIKVEENLGKVGVYAHSFEKPTLALSLLKMTLYIDIITCILSP